jgi:hypothetical protein
VCTLGATHCQSQLLFVFVFSKFNYLTNFYVIGQVHNWSDRLRVSTSLIYYKATRQTKILALTGPHLSTGPTGVCFQRCPVLFCSRFLLAHAPINKRSVRLLHGRRLRASSSNFPWARHSALPRTTQARHGHILALEKLLRPLLHPSRTRSTSNYHIVHSLGPESTWPA